MVKTHRIAYTDPTTPPTPQRDECLLVSKMLFPVPPESAATAPLASPMQAEHDKSHETKSRQIVNISDLTHIHLHPEDI